MVPRLASSSPHQLGMRTGRVALLARRRLLVVRASQDGGQESLHERAISVMRTAQQLDWREYMPTSVARLGGTLVVSNAANKDLVQQAHAAGNLSFGFSAGGNLFPYYLGTVGALQDGGVLTPDTKLAGASAGSLIAACVKAGMPLGQITEQCLALMADCRANGTRGRLGPVLEAFLRAHLPADAHVRCSGRSFVAVTRALPYIKPKLLSQFKDRDDLIHALLTSCHIPYWLDGNAFTPFRGEPHLDGGLTNFIPLPPGTVGVRVCCFPAKQMSPVYRVGIAPDLFGPWPYSMRQMVGWAFEPADEDVVMHLIDKGKRDAQTWMDEMGLRAAKEAPEGEAAAGAGQVAATKEASGSDPGREQQRQQDVWEREREQRGEQETEREAEAAGARAA